MNKTPESTGQREDQETGVASCPFCGDSHVTDSEYETKDSFLNTLLPSEIETSGIQATPFGGRPVVKGERILCWFSCGAASAVATKLTIEVFGLDQPVVPVYCNVLASEHPDNSRFMRDCERWFERDVVKIGNSNFLNGRVEEVFQSKRYMSGIAGACCTAQLKKVPRFQFANSDDIHVFGFTSDEGKRIADFEIRNPELNLLWMLRDHNVTKQDCYQRLMKAGIELPKMYQLGYRNNNCIGCVKATSPGYWAKIREDFPAKFAERAKQSREIGCKLVQLKGARIFLDELPDQPFKYRRENISCGPECGSPVPEVEETPVASV